ncbi:MAG: acyl carrier protein [Gemmatimonas sp.]
MTKVLLTHEQILQLITDGLITTFRLDRERIVLSARLYEDLDIDSIDAVDLAARLQRETGARLSSEVFKSVRTVGDLTNALDHLLNHNSDSVAAALRVQDQPRH